MITWILVVFVMGSNGDAVTSVPGFASAQECAQAGQLVRGLGALFHNVQTVCVAQSHPAPLPPEKKP